MNHLNKKIVASHVFPSCEGYSRLNTSVPLDVLQEKMRILKDRYAGPFTSSGFNGQNMIFKGRWLGRLELIKYYKKTDSSKAYPTTTFCDSSIKNRFGTSSNWGEYSLIAMDQVEDKWNESYKPDVFEDSLDTVEYTQVVISLPRLLLICMKE
ncbi:hypothetical protein HPULCUR_008518 [Helicostylum pulchrum]|uniref:Uncharacterized protein n=1 Tax=Helicostylum pulchrum TaxID=562976 RepID=A0ABP9Y859_9FUNG